MRERDFRIGPVGWLIAGRGAPGLAAIVLAARGGALGAGIALVLAAAADVLVASIASRRGWVATGSDVELEGFVDFTCFVWAPVALALSAAPDRVVAAAAMPFVAAGAYRLARFNVEGMVGRGYRGLPVTYGGLAVPAAVASGSPIAIAATLVLLAVLMASARFVTPRIGW